jgi:hypothetical protein
MLSLFGNGFKGLAESKWAGIAGSVFRAVGIDYRSTPGLIKVHQKLTKNSPSSGGNQVTELCKTAIPVSDGSTLWFSSESGKIWREVNGTWTLLYNFALSTFNIFTAGDADKSFTLATATKPFFSSDGLSMFTLIYDGSTIRQYRLNSAYDVASAVLVYSAAVKSNARDLFIDSTGTHLILCTNDRVFKYTMSTAWNLNTLSIDADVGLVLDTETVTAEGVWADDDGETIYVLSGGDNKIYQYDLITPWIWWEEVDFLLIAGGGGGGGTAASIGNQRAGGGAGEVIEDDVLLIPSTNHEENAGEYAIAIGDGGAGGVGNNNGAAGEQSTFAGFTADGGLGSNDGVGGASGNSFTGGTASTQAAGGGAGSTGNGANGADAGGDGTGGNGGAGHTSSITGSPVAYAGGGGGGASPTPGTGAAGGGNGSSNGNATNATANTGSGGGGANTEIASARNGGAGGSGLLIIRYRTAAMNITGGSAATDGSHTVRTFTADSSLTFVEFTRTAFVSAVTTHTFPNSVGRMRDVFFKADGSRLWVATNEEIVQYDLETPWDIDTLQPSTARIAPGTPYGVFITADGAYALITFATSISRYPLLTSGNTILGAAEHAITQAANDNFEDAALDQITLTGTDAFFHLTDDTSLLTGDCLRIARKLVFDNDEKFDTVVARFTETGINGGYELKASIVSDIAGEPTGAVIATKTVAIAGEDISAATPIYFTFDDPITLGASLNYWVIFEIADYTDIGSGQDVRLLAYEETGADVLRVYTQADGWMADGFEGSVQPEDADIPLKLFLANPAGDDAATEEETVRKIYFAVDKFLFEIPSDELSTFSTSVRRTGVFENGSTTHHPMAVQNLSLFIGDGDVVAEVDNVGGFVQETELNLPDGETVQALYPFDTDLLIGSKAVNMGHVRRWDTVSESWSAQDDVYDEEGVTAFLGDDNYVYPITGPFGRIYFYDGEKMLPYVQIPGEWGPSKKAVIHANSIAFWMNLPLFGLSNSTGNPQLQGIYGLGSFGRGFDKTLSLDFPISAGTFDNITIGAILVKGADLMIAWKTASAAGVDKLDWSAKYASAYFETRILNEVSTSKGIATARHIQKTLQEVAIPYADLPANTGITMAYKKQNEANYTNLAAGKDSTEKQKLYFDQTVPKMAAPQLRASFTVSSNNAPAIEDVLVDIIAAE